VPAASSLKLVESVAGTTAPAALARELVDWVDATPGMRRFVEANAPKIRRKLREARDAETVRDLRAELLAAALLLADRRIEVAYEAAGAGRGGPDFAVTFRGGTVFNVEVTRRRASADTGHVADAVLTKLRQLPPSVSNVLVVALDRPIDIPAINAAMIALRARADARDVTTLARARAADPRAFYDRYLRLAAVVVWSEASGPDQRVAAWPNPSARIPLDRAALGAVERALAAG
jgi:hypothetical protein